MIAVSAGGFQMELFRNPAGEPPTTGKVLYLCQSAGSGPAEGRVHGALARQSHLSGVSALLSGGGGILWSFSVFLLSQPKLNRNVVRMPMLLRHSMADRY